LSGWASREEGTEAIGRNAIERLLAREEQHIALREREILGQRQLLFQLERKGHDTRSYKLPLAVLEVLLDEHLKSRKSLREALEGGAKSASTA
jgi:hypothetical protein